VKHVPEKLESPYRVEKCDFMDGCECSIAKVIPEKARGRPFDTVTHVIHIVCWNWGEEVV
jgi:hypothetical protein